MDRIWALPVLGVVLIGAGCRQVSDKYIADLTHGDPVVRVRAAARLGNLNRKDAAPDLIARLDDEDEAVRSVAAMSLRHISGRHFGYNPREDAPGRAEAIGRWQAWWERETGTSSGRSVREPVGRSPGSRPSAAGPTTRPQK